MPSEWNTAVSAEGTKMPTVDVLIPVYNAARTLVQSVKTIQDQSVKDIRIIIIDDGSTDVSLPLIKEIAANDPRVLTLEKKRNSGIVDSLNLGLAQCTAHLIARHDADDLADPNRFDRQIVSPSQVLLDTLTARAPHSVQSPRFCSRKRQICFQYLPGSRIYFIPS